MFFQSGTDGKPLHAGLAARNGVWAYELLQHTSLQTSTKPFDPERGWFKTIGNITVTSNDIASRWLAPGQLIDPGLWMKVHPYCSEMCIRDRCCTVHFKMVLLLTKT